MTFADIQNSVAERLNLTSADSLARIGRNINDRYRRLTSNVGLATSRRATDTQNTVGNDPHVTFALEKLERVYTVDTGKRRVLDEISYDEWRALDTWLQPLGDSTRYAIETAGAASVTIVLTPTPSSVFAINADGLANAATLADTDVPAFPADFHDALVFGAMADEYNKMQNAAQAQQFETLYESRAADLRYFLAKSIYLTQHQGRRGRTRLLRPPMAWWR